MLGPAPGSSSERRGKALEEARGDILRLSMTTAALCAVLAISACSKGDPGDRGPAGPKGEPGPAGSSIHVVNGGADASCPDGESMITAYCIGKDTTPTITSTTAARCEGEGAKTVVACVKK